MYATKNKPVSLRGPRQAVINIAGLNRYVDHTQEMIQAGQPVKVNSLRQMLSTLNTASTKLEACVKAADQPTATANPPTTQKPTSIAAIELRNLQYSLRKQAEQIDLLKHRIDGLASTALRK